MSLLRRQIDQKLSKIKDWKESRPSIGWIKTIRKALGMTRSQLALRMNVAPQTVEKLEKSEAADTISLKSLQKIAQALECQLVYALIPEVPIQKTVELQTLKKAKEMMAILHHTMLLEDQGISEEERDAQLAEIIEDIKRKKNISMIWDIKE